MKNWCVYLWLAGCGTGVLAQEVPPTHDDPLARAIARYEEAMEASDRDDRMRGFSAAEQLFRQGIESHPPQARSAELYVNLGNAALQAEHIGPAIIAYRRALGLDPTNVQAQQNLSFARMIVPEIFRHEVTSGLVSTLFFWIALFPCQQVVGIAALCFLLAAGMFAFGIVVRQPIFRNLAVIPAMGWAMCWLSLLMAANPSTATDAVVVANDVILRSADSEKSPPRLSEALTSGVEVRVLRERERWTEVQIPGGRTGWVRHSTVESL